MSQQEDEQLILKEIEKKIALYPDFPKRGILFRDAMPILGDPISFKTVIDILCKRIGQHVDKCDRVLGIESRGFLFGPTIAKQLGLPFTPIRKAGKLPGDLYSIRYQLEYGTDCLEIQKSALPQGSRCLIVDDLLATGGSMEAAKKLIEMTGSKIVCCAVIIELTFMKGRDKLKPARFETLFTYD